MSKYACACPPTQWMSSAASAVQVKSAGARYFVKNAPVRASSDGYRPVSRPGMLFEVNEEVEYACGYETDFAWSAESRGAIGRSWPTQAFLPG